MATFTATKLSGLVQALETLDLPNPFHNKKRRRSPSRSPSSSSASLLLQRASSEESFVVSTPPSQRTIQLQESISCLPPTKPTRDQLKQALQALTNEEQEEKEVSSSSNQDDVDTDEEDLLAWTLIGRIVLGLYGQTVEDLVECAGVWEEEIAWWRALEARGRWSWGGIGGYLFMSEYERAFNSIFFES